MNLWIFIYFGVFSISLLYPFVELYGIHIWGASMISLINQTSTKLLQVSRGLWRWSRITFCGTCLNTGFSGRRSLPWVWIGMPLRASFFHIELVGLTKYSCTGNPRVCLIVQWHSTGTQISLFPLGVRSESPCLSPFLVFRFCFTWPCAGVLVCVSSWGCQAYDAVFLCLPSAASLWLSQSFCPSCVEIPGPWGEAVYRGIHLGFRAPKPFVLLTLFSCGPLC